VNIGDDQGRVDDHLEPKIHDIINPLHKKFLEDLPKDVTPESGLPFRDCLFCFLEGYIPDAYTTRHPIWFQATRHMTWVTEVMIIASCICPVVRTMPQYYDVTPASIHGVEATYMIWFMLSYLLRFACCRDRYTFRTDFNKIIDFVATAPYPFMFMDETDPRDFDGLLGFLHLRGILSLLRVLKVASGSEIVRDLGSALKQSHAGVMLLFYLMFICLSLFSSIIFYAETSGAHFEENGSQWVYDDPTFGKMEFQSFFHSMWWAIVTMSTCGYGDMVPQTNLGKCIGSITVITGIMTLSYPSVMFGAAFQRVLAKRRRAEQRDEANHMQSGVSLTTAVEWALNRIPLPTSSHNKAKGSERSRRFSKQWEGGSSKASFSYPEGRSHIGVYAVSAEECVYDAVLQIPRSLKHGMFVQDIYPSGCLIYIPIILSSQLSSEMAAAAMRAHDPTTSWRAAPRRIQRIHVSIGYEDGLRCVCSQFERPQKNVLPVVLQCTTDFVDKQGLDDMLALVQYNFDIHYEEEGATGTVI